MGAQNQAPSGSGMSSELAALKAELEQERLKSLLAQEANTTLRTKLASECSKSEDLGVELSRCKKWNLELQTLSEHEEENITNKLIKRLTDLKREKEELAMQVEAEEEFLTNSLQAKLNQVRKEKVDLEVELENEQEQIFNRLHKQLTTVTAEKESLEARLGADSTVLLDALDATIRRLKQDSTFLADKEQVKLLDRTVQEIQGLKDTQENAEKERGEFKVKNRCAKDELLVLQRENSVLRGRVAQEHEMLLSISEQKSRLECEREEDLERLYNMGAMHPESATPIFSYVRNRSGSVSSQDSHGHEALGRFRSTSSPGSPPSHSGNSTRSSTRSSTPFERRSK